MPQMTALLLATLPTFAEDAPAPTEAAPAPFVTPAPMEAAAAESPAASELPTLPQPQEDALAPAPVEEPAPVPPEEPVTEPAPTTPDEPAPAPATEEPAPLLPAAAIPPTAEPAAAPAPLPQAQPLSYEGIVRIEVAARRPDYATPWQAGGYGRGNGTGFMVAPGVFMTNAHVVADAERIHVSLYADARKFPARVKHIAHDADLALIEVEDTAPFAQLPCLEFCDRLPHLEEVVRAIGYPIGGKRLSVTRGIVSRIESNTYSHPGNQGHLTVQIDAAINPGNSGGPVLLGDKVIGVAFQGLRDANSTGYMIPIPVIERFLRDVEDGHYDRYVDLGVRFFPLENPGMRRHYGLADDGRGALVGDVFKGSCCDGLLQPGDVVLAVNGLPVDSSAMIELEGERVELAELAERAFTGDKVVFDLLRDGNPQRVEATLAPLTSTRITARAYDELPRYVVFGGLVFQPMQANVIMAHNVQPIDVLEDLEHYTKRGGAQQKQDVVLLTKVLPDEVNARFEDFGRSIVTKVNGVEVQGLSHLHELLYAAPAEGQERPAYTVIELREAKRPLVIDNAAIDAANARINARYNIPEAARLNSEPAQ